ncbi:uncharacterized protein si:dkey-92i15.4 [Cyprinodon tularosa]|uniref:uncharacterized protein si:dkey-92i15.4 n=1 Tax=Cyprinodon tularosa TaxID=77115 RepID=UPI0018E277CB|nr:uncharacterized protein si:dkey-92i15.4 [Cyprinodon tularosa]XP_038146173.1 uncharacterized protein si:dkey-92i15.4 [Cyprinodon tularosa]XP_038146174.1 uncharacterized protein si:dkey-92i15.4 [Cyprinodon tularosa]
MDLLPPSTSENISTRTGGRFTVRSANSPSYSLNRRSGFRKRPLPDNVESNNDTAINKDVVGTTHTELSKKDRSERKHTENGTDVGTQLFISRESTEGRRGNLKSKHLSLDRGLDLGSSPLNVRDGMSNLLGKREAGDFEKQNKDIENISRGTSSSLKGFKTESPSYIKGKSSYNKDFAGGTSKVNSLPFRFRTESVPSSRFTDDSLGSEGGQSIQERIQKLFESAGETTVGGTFPRRFSSGEVCSPVRKTVPSFLAQKETNRTRSETVASPHAVQLKERSTGTQWQGEFKSNYLEDDKKRREKMEMGTKSLDRGRSRNTIAANLRSLRAAESMAKSQTFIGDTSSIFQQKKGNINQEDCRADTRERMKVRESNIERDEETKAQTGLKSVTAEDDVFDEGPRKGTLQLTERKRLTEILSVPSSTSVRNKINQFEALTQRATSQVQASRRLFSAPANPFETQERIKRRGSAIKNIDEQSYKQEEKRDEKEEEKKKPASERSLSVDEVIIRLGKLETDGVHLLDKRKNDFSEDISKYSIPKKNLHIPLDEETRRHSKLFCFDETDLVKHLSPEDSNIKNMTTKVQPRPPSEISSPVSEDEQTPTNTPLNTSPFLSPVSEPENTFPVADNATLPVFGKKVKTKDTDSTLLPAITTLSQNNKSDVFITHKDKTQDKVSTDLPTQTSSQDWSDVFYPDVKNDLPKGRKRLADLNAWIAGLNPEDNSWNDFIGEYEDDESTQKDDDSNYDSDSGESSVTITSNMSQSEHKSFSLSFSDLVIISGTDYESENDMEDWQLSGRRSVSLSSDISTFSCVSLLPTEEIDKLVEDVKNLGDETLQDYDDVQVVVLHKEVGVGLGFSLAGGVDQNKPITVRKVFNSGVAAQEGSIREGDRVLSINGTALSETGHWQAVKILRKAKDREMAVVVLRKGDLSGGSKLEVQGNNEMATTTQYETGQRVCVQLQKNSRDLGFSLFGGVGSSEGNRPLTVKTIFPGGPADKVFPGDEILEIQGTSVVRMRRPEVLAFIKNLSSGPVEVVLQRPLKVTEL